ncbi:MAG: DnaJ C-terminal domain-containing protein [Candidatus Caenarcaniphilales bacterium]|nr:DnaJ C-terminal domain-containing protein [Candidatus Caenarcaniphilales bacterium]
MAEEDFYTLLNVTRTSSITEIKQSYKKLARQYHPDNKDTGNEELFKKLSEAYTVLTDEQKRAYYDRVGHEAFTKGGSASYGSAYQSSEIFDDLQGVFDSFFGPGFGGGGFGRRQSKNRKERGSDIQVVLELDFMEAAFGGTKKAVVNKLTNCAECNGIGADPSVGTKTCTTCQGNGEVRKVTQSFLGVITQVSPCPTCNGRGTVNPVPCKACKGNGQLRTSDELEVKVPKGAEHGSRLVWSGKGNDGKNGGPAGDLYLLLKVKPHPKLKRQGLDIFEELDVTVWQAILGDELESETIHGKQNVTLKAGTQPSTVIKLNSLGIQMDNGKSGNHHIKINVVVPNKKDIPKNLLDSIQQEIGAEDKSGMSAFANFFRRSKPAGE